MSKFSTLLKKRMGDTIPAFDSTSVCSDDTCETCIETLEETDVFHPELNAGGNMHYTGITMKQYALQVIGGQSYIVGSKRRAQRILNALSRFDREGGLHPFRNVFTLDKDALTHSIECILRNSLKKERIPLILDSINAPPEIREAVSPYLKVKKGDVEEHATAISGILYPYLLESSETREVYHDINPNDLTSHDPRVTLDVYSGHFSPLLRGSLRYGGGSSRLVPRSQKANGVMQLSESAFKSQVSLHLPLETAREMTPQEIMMNVKSTFGESQTWQNLFVRTCPASPRPGSLPNVLAKTPRELVDGIKILATSMLDPEHDDYDPEGCLIVQPFIDALCSGVMSPNAGEFSVGPRHDGVTAGGGSNLIFTLSGDASMRLARKFSSMGLDDGMQDHELEFVYPKKSQGHTVGNLFKRLAQQRHGRLSIDPIFTQARGLHTQKPPLLPPPMVGDVPLYIRGNVPSGTIVQKATMNVGAGDLESCSELERQGNDGTLPEGLVVYAPAGSPAAHVAGVGLDFDVPIIYGVKPRKNGISWTEINGWVTDIEGAEPSVYDPNPFKEFYIMGLHDGDAHWTYNLSPLSQFFHNFLSGPKNDPRLEAYLAGVFTTWITKAALLVGMAEFRHGLGGRAEVYPWRAFVHTTIQQIISDTRTPISLMRRGEYYQRFCNLHLGYDTIEDLTSFYVKCFHEDYCPWSGGSFGGKNYLKSLRMAGEVARAVKAVLSGENVDIKNLLGLVNRLENAVHNTGFFFNKFMKSKASFDIGTGGHPNFSHAPYHWVVTAPFLAKFYGEHLEETERVAKWCGQKSLTGEISSLTPRQKSLISDLLKKSDSSTPISFSSQESGLALYKPAFEHFVGKYHMHNKGLCGLSECMLDECKSFYMIKKSGLNEEEADFLTEIWLESLHGSTYQFNGPCMLSEAVSEVILPPNTRSISQTAYASKKREIAEVVDITTTQPIEDTYLFILEHPTFTLPRIYVEIELKRWYHLLEKEFQDLSPIEFLLLSSNPENHPLYRKAVKLDSEYPFSNYDILSFNGTSSYPSMVAIFRGMLRYFLQSRVSMNKLLKDKKGLRKIKKEMKKNEK